MNKPLIIIGNGGHASVLTETLLAQDEKIIGFTALNEEDNSFNLRYLGQDDIVLQYNPKEIDLVLGIGMVGPNSLRTKIYQHFTQLGYSFKSVIHQTAIIASSVTLGEGVQMMAGTIAQTNVKIADNTIINTGAQIDHDCMIREHIHIAPGAVLSGAVTIGEGTHIGTGVTVIQNITIGKGCLIGAGAVVLKNIEDNKTAYGVPAKEV
ncbi:acetyltransferase [Lysinibacillus capsici]|uniref:acetyltransferase n=1 Tax=Lysinibacillus TaxID=400634 RepID=UPI001EDB4C8E|nr:MULTISPECIES: acetyltransferase [Lysinibacillus]MDP1393418.1 acetyltransferase [Lysinibacillus capsici]MDP1413892.1 acetyltransferase [Lysinibacillus capsici]MDP1429170.1 acetyltransferase [Lysinibacillus capsici]UKJ46050.1 acetyltransferase [Lysinibacillus sp. ACHW1.5]WBF56544.1 acetyltransferase [Lysinibacillus sp. JK80]